MRKITSENSASLVLRGIAVILMIIPVFYTAAHVSSIPQYKRTLIYIVLAVLAEVLTVYLHKNHGMIIFMWPVQR